MSEPVSIPSNLTPVLLLALIDLHAKLESDARQLGTCAGRVVRLRARQVGILIASLAREHFTPIPPGPPGLAAVRP